MAILGPNGSGKTTLLRCLAGLQPIDGGCISLGDTVLDDPSTDTFIPPERRHVSFVFQDYLLFAHLNAIDNVAFGLQARGVARRVARLQASEWLERLGLGTHLRHAPGALSGGQQQRVALARALATEPQLLLLDEPLAALDATTHAAVRRELREHLRGFGGARVLITHNPLDAYALADRIIVLEGGRATQSGTLASITARPRSRYVAQLFGTNFLAGHTVGDTFTSDGGGTLVVDATDNGPTYASIAPSAISIFRAQPDGSPRNVWRTTITNVESTFDRVRVGLGEPLPMVAEITAAGLAALDRHPGDEVWAALKTTEITTYPA